MGGNHLGQLIGQGIGSAVEDRRGGHKHRIYTDLFTEGQILLRGVGIASQVFLGTKLERVHKDAYYHQGIFLLGPLH